MLKLCDPEYLIADIVADCDQVPEPLVMRALIKAARKFANTCIYSQWIDIPTQANVQHYPFERFMPEGFSVQYVTDVEYNGCCVPCLDDKCGMGCASGYKLDGLQQITLVGYCPQSEDPKDPECYDRLRVKVVLKIANDACQLPCEMIERFEEELLDGAMGQLLAMKNKPWTDFRAAEFHENRFEGGLASAKCLVANKMNNRGARMDAECLI